MLFVGLDVGGTKTQVQVVDAALTPVLLFETPGADITAKTASQVEHILNDILTRLRKVGKPLGGVVLGMPGYGEAESWVRDLESICRTVFSRTPYRLLNDVELALEAAFPKGAGIIALAGTGSMAYAKDGMGYSCRVGGWGTLFGDEGSAYAVGVAALRAVSRDVDGRGPATTLTKLLLQQQDSCGLWQLFPNGTDAARAEVASLARQVERAASEGDSVSLTILRDAAAALLEQVEAARNQLGLPVEIALATIGGMFKSGTLEHLFTESARAIGYTLVEPAAQPSLGGARLAYQLFGSSSFTTSSS